MSLTDNGRTNLQSKIGSYRLAGTILQAIGILAIAAGLFTCLLVFDDIAGQDDISDASKYLAYTGVLAGTSAPGLIAYGIGKLLQAVSDYFAAITS